MLLKMEEFSVLQVKTQNRAQRRGTRESTNSSYHINHSSKVVHLKWGVKRSLILPRSSCFKTENTVCSPPLWMCGHRLVAWDRWTPEAGREVSGGQDTQVPRTRDSDPRPSAPPSPGRPSARTHWCPEVETFHTPPQPGILELGSRPLRLGPSEASWAIPWTREQTPSPRCLPPFHTLPTQSQL